MNDRNLGRSDREIVEEHTVHDPQARRMAHAALQRFANGETTNDEFETEWPDTTTTDDRALRAIETMVWCFYNDHEVHRLTGAYALPEGARQLIDRCLLFLQSSYRYQWPVDDFIGLGTPSGVLNVVTFGALNREVERRHRMLAAELANAGDVTVWPFINRAQYETLLQSGQT